MKIGLSSLENQVFSNGQFSKTFNKLSVGQYTCTLSYAGNDYFKAASITFPFWVIEAEYVVHDLTQFSEHQDVTILTSAPNLSGYAEDDLILIDDDIGNYDELILEDTIDTTGLGDDDTILLNDETDDIEVLIVELEDDEED